MDGLTGPAASVGPGDGFVSLHPAAPFIWRLAGVPVTIGAGIVAVLIALVADGIGAAAVAVAAVSLGVVAVGWWYPEHRYRHWRYRIGATSLELSQGVWFRSSAAVPFHRIQQIDVEQGPLQRRHGVVTLRLRTAAAGSDGIIPHLAAAEADVVRERLLAAARAAAAVDDGH